MGTALATRPLIRIRPAPRCEPGEDDQLRGDPESPRRPRIDWVSAPTHDTATGDAATHDAPGDEAPGQHAFSHDAPAYASPARSAPTSGRPATAGETGAPGSVLRPGEARLAAHRYLNLCVEVLGGFRPAAHLRVMTAVEAYDHVIAQLRPPRARQGGPGERVVLRHVRVFEPVEGAAEVAAVLSRGERVWAMALRMERSPFGWLCRQLWVL